MEVIILRLRRFLQRKGEIAFWLFPLGMIIDSYGDKKEKGYLPIATYPACGIIEGTKLAIIFYLVQLIGGVS